MVDFEASWEVIEGKTPHLDALAGDGVTFSNAYVICLDMCAPSRGWRLMLLVGISSALAAISIYRTNYTHSIRLADFFARNDC